MRSRTIVVTRDLCGKISNAIREIASPEGQEAFVAEGLHGTIDHTIVWFGDDTLFQHFTLILDE